MKYAMIVLCAVLVGCGQSPPVISELPPMPETQEEWEAYVKASRARLQNNIRELQGSINLNSELRSALFKRDMEDAKLWEMGDKAFCEVVYARRKARD